MKPSKPNGLLKNSREPRQREFGHGGKRVSEENDRGDLRRASEADGSPGDLGLNRLGHLGTGEATGVFQQLASLVMPAMMLAKPRHLLCWLLGGLAGVYLVTSVPAQTPSPTPAPVGTTVNSSSFNLPIGQAFKDFSYPFYSNGKLQTLFIARSATGVTASLAQAHGVKIFLFDTSPPSPKRTGPAVSPQPTPTPDPALVPFGGDTPTTLITSPFADLYITSKVMRTVHTVKIEREDAVMTSDQGEFDLTNKTYQLRRHVRMILKNLDLSSSSSTQNQAATGRSPSLSGSTPSNRADGSPHPSGPASPTPTSPP